MKIIKQDMKKTYQRDAALTNTVLGIIDKVRTDKDKALIQYAQNFDHIDIDSVLITREQIENAYKQVSQETIDHIKFAAKQIENYAKHQLATMQEMEFKSEVPGVTLGHRRIPVETVGSYIPSGRYPLPSSALMNILTAKVAGVKNVYACAPPFKGYGTIHPVVLVAMDISGADEIYCMGGAQAIAAFAYGTETVKKVDLIVGPGNKYVTEAKRQVLGDVGIDSLAGPSEVLIIADETAKPLNVAIDLLGQGEHDPDAKPILVSTSQKLIDDAMIELERLLKDLPTKEVAKVSWENNGRVILADNMQEAIDITNEIAPEHLEVQTDDALDIAKKLDNYGSLFIGHWTPVAFGDFVSGTNHTLPTMSTARYSSGLWVGTFLKCGFYQHLTEEGCRNLSETCMHIAELEGLYAHRDSVRLRVQK